jgi:hypothetical protein
MSADGKKALELRLFDCSPANPMKIAPPANEAERRALQARLEREHGRRVDVLKNLWGWYARFFKAAPRRKLQGQAGQ